MLAVIGLSSCIKVEEKLCDGTIPSPTVSPTSLSISVGNSLGAQVAHPNSLYTYTWYDPQGNAYEGNGIIIPISSVEQSGTWKVRAIYEGGECVSDYTNFTVNASYVSPNCNLTASIFRLDYGTSYTLANYITGPKQDYYQAQWLHTTGSLTMNFKEMPKANHAYRAVSWSLPAGGFSNDQFSMTFVVNGNVYFPSSGQKVYTEEHNGKLYFKFCTMSMSQNGFGHTGTAYLPLN